MSCCSQLKERTAGVCLVEQAARKHLAHVFRVSIFFVFVLVVVGFHSALVQKNRRLYQTDVDTQDVRPAPVAKACPPCSYIGTSRSWRLNYISYVRMRAAGDGESGINLVPLSASRSPLPALRYLHATYNLSQSLGYFCQARGKRVESS